MPTPAPRLLPIFRSNTQLRILVALFVFGGTYSLTELAERTGLSVPLVSREVNRLEGTGLVLTQPRGQLKLVTANEDHPSAAPLRQLLDQTAGASHHVQSLLAQPRWHQITEAVIFGSWAERFAGVAGPAPNDLDVLLVADQPLSMQDVTQFQRELSSRISLPVDAFGVTADEWADPEAGTATAAIRAGNHVSVAASEADKAEEG